MANNEVVIKAHNERFYLEWFNNCFGTEYLYETTFSFKRGKIYGLLCERDEGGGAISWLLSGMEKVCEQEVDVFGKIYDREQTIEEGWFLGAWNVKSNKRFGKQLNEAIRANHRKSNSEELLALFDFDKEILKYKPKDQNWNQWMMSVLLGYAYDKSIYGFPWLNTYLLKHIIMDTHFFHIMDIIRRNNGIVLIPSDNRKILEAISDQVVELNNPACKDMSKFENYIADYKNKKLGF